MADTVPRVDIDLTRVPAQRISPEDTLEVIHHAPVVSEPRVARRSDRRMWLALLALFAAAGFAVGVPAGLMLAPSQQQPAPSPDRGDSTALLLDPVGRQAPQPVVATDQQDLINHMVTPGPG